MNVLTPPENTSAGSTGHAGMAADALVTALSLGDGNTIHRIVSEIEQSTRCASTEDSPGGHLDHFLDINPAGVDHRVAQILATFEGLSLTNVAASPEDGVETALSTGSTCLDEPNVG
jgi:hypothetical protein